MTPRDPEATKARILAAALHEFAAKGIAGARVDAIAARAKVNKRMLYHYFGSKEGLYREILSRRLHDRMPTLQSAVAAPERLVERAERVAGDVEYQRLLLWEALETGTGPSVNEDERRRFFGAWVASIEEAQRAGQLPGDLDARQLLLEELFSVLGPWLLPQFVRVVTGRPNTDRTFLAERREFLRALTGRLDRAAAPTAVAE
jgi:AcrR family transcriptional regulator